MKSGTYYKGSSYIASFEEFCKQTLPSKEVKGTSEIVKDHYSTEKDAKLSDPKNVTVSGNGSVEHTETLKTEDLGDPKVAIVK